MFKVILNYIVNSRLVFMRCRVSLTTVSKINLYQLLSVVIRLWTKVTYRRKSLFSLQFQRD